MKPILTGNKVRIAVILALWAGSLFCVRLLPPATSPAGRSVSSIKNATLNDSQIQTRRELLRRILGQDIRTLVGRPATDYSELLSLADTTCDVLDLKAFVEEHHSSFAAWAYDTHQAKMGEGFLFDDGERGLGHQFLVISDRRIVLVAHLPDAFATEDGEKPLPKNR